MSHRRELDRGIVTNAPDAARVERVLYLLPEILLRHDPRVQAVFAAWRQRIDDEAPRPSSYTWPAVKAGLIVDLRAIVGLIADLGLSQYQSWLAAGLLLAFLRAIQIPIGETLAPVDTWAARGKRPKSKGPKGYRLEDLERVMLTFYRCEVQLIPKKRLALVEGRARADVQHDCKRAQELLACINAAPPPDFARS
jgi:hypothetical protein